MPLPARALGRGRSAAAAFVVSTAVLWAWHVPVAHDDALSHVGFHWLMQFSLLASAVWSWRAVVATAGPPLEALAPMVAGFAQARRQDRAA